MCQHQQWWDNTGGGKASGRGKWVEREYILKIVILSWGIGGGVGCKDDQNTFPKQ